MRIRNALLTIFVISLTCRTASLSAVTFPEPGNNPDLSMIGFYINRSPEFSDNELKGRINISIIGPETLRLPIGNEEWEILWLKVKPGSYSFDTTEAVILTGGVPNLIEVPRGTVILAPFRLERDAEGIRALLVDEEVRQRAGRNLASHVDFPLWSDRNLIGFGGLRPEVDSEVLYYNIKVQSETPDSEIYVDDVFMGTAPLDIALTGGKHRVLIRAPGFEDAVYFIRLEGEATINADLEPAASESQSDRTERYRTLVGPFLSFTEPDDQLSRLFADTLLLALESDSRLEPVPAAIPWTRKDALVHPDFLPLEEVGADLVVSGFFGTRDGRLTVQANLYDVQAETVRAAVTWLGTAGFDIFDAMDEIALEFAGEVDRVLPEAGRTLITRRETVYGGIDRNAGLLARKKIIRKRWVENPNVLTFQSGFGGMFEKIPITGSTSQSDENRFDGPYIPITISWDRDQSPLFSLGIGLNVTTGGHRYDENNDLSEWIAMGGLFGGPRLMFRSLRADIILSLDLQVIYAPELTYYWDEGVPDQGDAGPFIYVDLPLKITFRYYFNKRTDRTPLFINGGFGVSPVGYRFDLKGRGQGGLVDANFSINLGMGIRL